MMNDNIIPEPEFSDVQSIPHSRDAEEGVIGAVMINQDCMGDIFDILQACDFYIDRHKWIYESLVRLFVSGVEIDMLTVANDLEQAGRLQEIGGTSYLTTLVNSVPNSMNAVDYANIVESYSVRRRMIAQANEIAQLAYDTTTNMDKVSQRFDAIVENKPAPSRTTNVSAKEAGTRLKEQFKADKPHVVPTGVANSDMYYGGYPMKAVTMIIGDNSIGKTARTLQACETLNFAKERSLYITLEEPVEGMVSRRVFGLTAIDYLKWLTCTLSPGEKVYLENEVDKYIANHPYMTFNEQARTVKAIRRAVKQCHPKLVIVDDLIHVFNAETNGSENQASGLVWIVQQLKEIAIDFDCAVVILHHLTVEEASKLWPGGKTPTMNVPPALDSMTWAKNMRFTVDLWLALVPDCKADIKDDIVKIIEWVMKNKRGKRLMGIEIHYDKIGQWFYDNSNVNQMPKYGAAKQVVSQMPANLPMPVPMIIEPADPVIFTEEQEWLKHDVSQ